MMKTKLSVTMLLIGCALFFSGCPGRVVHLPCKAEEPVRTFHKNCSSESNVTKFSECAIEKYLWLDNDYNILLTRFRSCK